jgi:hypothetical protein
MKKFHLRGFTVVFLPRKEREITEAPFSPELWRKRGRELKAHALQRLIP